MSNLDYKGNCSRRKRRKMKGASISIPCDPINENVKNQLKKMVNDGKYTIGEVIVPQKYEKQ